MQAVVRVAARDGFDALTYRAVAVEAGVSHGLVRYHFGTLERAIHEALEWTVDVAITSSPLTGARDVRAFADSLSRLVAENPDHAAFQQGLVMHAQRHPDLLDEIRAVHERYVDQIERELARLGVATSRPLARSVFALLNGIVLRQLAFRDPVETDEDVTVLHELLAALPPADNEEPAHPGDR